MGAKLAKGDGHAASFFTGVLAAVVATPCTAPFMGVATGAAMLLPPIMTIVIFSALGFGLALPYIVLTASPKLHSLLPKPGPWMETFRKILALPLYASTAWLIWVYTMQTPPLFVYLAMFGLVAISFAVGLIKKQKDIFIVLALFILLAGTIPTLMISKTQPHIETSIKDQGAWITYNEAKLERLLEEADRPIFVNMTAAWCITCKVNERIALDSEAGKALFKDNNVLQMKGDWTNRNKAITKFLASYNRNGVPLYVYYGAPDADSGTRPEPVLLPQILTPSLLKKTLKQSDK